MTDPALSAGTADLIGWRMRALGLWASLPGAAAAGQSDGAERVHAVAQGLLALQGQDWHASRWALGLRAPGTSDADVREAFARGLVVRSWPMRGTIHVVPAEDIGWMQQATNHRVLPGAAKRRTVLGLDDTSLARMTDVAVTALTGGKSLSRDELAEAWAGAGIEVQSAWRYHVVWWLCQNGLLVQGPSTDGGEPRLVLAEEWIRAPRALDGDEALAELAARFARGRGPVQDRDFAWWTGLPVTVARRGIAAAAAERRLAPVEVDDARYWAEPALLDGPSTILTGDAAAAAGVPEVLLLPGFDEHLLGYTERSSVLAPEHFERIVPGRNGMFRATVVERGRVRGIWLKTARAKATRIDAELFPGGGRLGARALRPHAAAWGAFQGVTAEIGSVVTVR